MKTLLKITVLLLIGINITTAKNTSVIDRFTPVMIGGDPDYDPCTYGRIAYSTPKGTPLGSVELKSGPGQKFKTIATIQDGTYVYQCDFKNGWMGIVYGKGACGTSSPIAKKQPYKGSCKSGWIPKSRYELLAG